MKNATLIKSYVNFSDANLDLKCKEIILKLTNNPNFPSTQPTLEVFTEIYNAYSTALSKATSRDKDAVAIKKAAKVRLVASMRLLAISIENQCMGDRVKMVNSGFDLASDGENVPALAAPESFNVQEGLNAGEIRSILTGTGKAISYLHEYSLTPPNVNTIWTSHAASTADQTLKGLPHSTRVYFRAAMIGSKNQIVYTDVISRMVQ